MLNINNKKELYLPPKWHLSPKKGEPKKKKNEDIQMAHSPRKKENDEIKVAICKICRLPQIWT